MVEQLEKLCILDLTDNQIRDEGLPMSLARLTQLKAIGLKKNCLTTVPRMLGYMQSLQEIYLEENADLEVCSLGQYPGAQRMLPCKAVELQDMILSKLFLSRQVQHVTAASVMTVWGHGMSSTACGELCICASATVC